MNGAYKNRVQKSIQGSYLDPMMPAGIELSLRLNSWTPSSFEHPLKAVALEEAD